MLINIQNKEDLITLDSKLKQIRYVRNISNQREIFFMELSDNEVNSYNYLLQEDKELFLKCVAEDISVLVGLQIKEDELILI